MSLNQKQDGKNTGKCLIGESESIMVDRNELQYSAMSFWEEGEGETTINTKKVSRFRNQEGLIKRGCC